MDGLTFTSDIIKSLAWPVAAVAIALVLRHPLGKLVPLLRKLKYGELEAEFSEKLDKVEKTAEKVLPQIRIAAGDVVVGGQRPPETGGNGHVAGRPDSQPAATSQQTLWSFDYDIIELAPASAIVRAWRRLDLALEQAGLRFGMHSSPIGMLHFLRDGGWITREQFELVLSVRKLRDLAAREGEVSVADAARFRDVIEPMIAYVNSLTPKPAPPDAQLKGA